MFKKFVSALTFTIAASAALVSHAQDTVKSLNFGIISTESSQNLRQDWAPVIDEMSKRLGVKVTAFFAPDYAGVIEGMRFNKVQFAWMGNKSAMEAVDRANAEIFAQTVNIDGTLGYYSYVSVHKDSPYKTIEDVLKNAKALNFGIGDPNSTSGFLVPSYYIFAKNNVDPKTAFKTVRGANHETNILAVANKQVDAAVHSSDLAVTANRCRPAGMAQGHAAGHEEQDQGIFSELRPDRPQRRAGKGTARQAATGRLQGFNQCPA